MKFRQGRLTSIARGLVAAPLCRGRHGDRAPWLQLGADLAPKIDIFDFSMPNLIAGLIFGSIGFVAFFYGRRMNLWKPMFCGLALMIYPYFVENVALLFGIGSLGTAALFFFRE
jgi:hypothetical protein